MQFLPVRNVGGACSEEHRGEVREGDALAVAADERRDEAARRRRGKLVAGVGRGRVVVAGAAFGAGGAEERIVSGAAEERVAIPGVACGPADEEVAAAVAAHDVAARATVQVIVAVVADHDVVASAALGVLDAGEDVTVLLGLPLTAEVDPYVLRAPRVGEPVQAGCARCSGPAPGVLHRHRACRRPAARPSPGRR